MRHITKDEALAAVARSKFATEDGRTILHCFRGRFGADWDVEAVEDLIFRADEIAWGRDMFGHNLLVRVGLDVFRFDVQAPVGVL